MDAVMEREELTEANIQNVMTSLPIQSRAYSVPMTDIRRVVVGSLHGFRWFSQREQNRAGALSAVSTGPFPERQLPL
jgi:hypothetical protein